jgi:hypothetical protein
VPLLVGSIFTGRVALPLTGTVPRSQVSPGVAGTVALASITGASGARARADAGGPWTRELAPLCTVPWLGSPDCPSICTPPSWSRTSSVIVTASGVLLGLVNPTVSSFSGEAGSGEGVSPTAEAWDGGAVEDTATASSGSRSSCKLARAGGATAGGGASDATWAQLSVIPVRTPSAAAPLEESPTMHRAVGVCTTSCGDGCSTMMGTLSCGARLPTSHTSARLPGACVHVVDGWVVTVSS